MYCCEYENNHLRRADPIYRAFLSDRTCFRYNRAMIYFWQNHGEKKSKIWQALRLKYIEHIKQNHPILWAKND